MGGESGSKVEDSERRALVMVRAVPGSLTDCRCVFGARRNTECSHQVRAAALAPYVLPTPTGAARHVLTMVPPALSAQAPQYDASTLTAFARANPFPCLPSY